MKKNSLGFRLLRLVTFWVTGNLTAIFAIWHAAVGWKILVGILCGILFLFFQFAHVHTIAGEKKLAHWHTAVICSAPALSGFVWNFSLPVHFFGA